MLETARAFSVVLAVALLFGCCCSFPKEKREVGNNASVFEDVSFELAEDEVNLSEAGLNESWHELSALESKIIEFTNEARAAHGLAPLGINPKLVVSSRLQACCLMENSILEHESVECGTLEQRLALSGVDTFPAGENLAKMPEASVYVNGVPARVYSEEELANKTVSGWMESASHRANILNASFTQVGVGACKGGAYYYIVQNFLAFTPCGKAGEQCCPSAFGLYCNPPARCEVNSRTCRA